MTLQFAKLTDEMIERARRRIGLEKRCRNQMWNVATKDAIRNFAWGFGDLNPLWHDENYARDTTCGTILAPPHFPISGYIGPIYPMPDDRRTSKGEGFPGMMSLGSGHQFTFYEPIRLDDKVETFETTVGIVDPDKRVAGDLTEPSADIDRAIAAASNRWGAHKGRMVDQVRQFKTYASGKLACVGLYHTVRVERGAVTVETGKYCGLGLPHYTEADLKRIGDAYENEFRRGRDTLYWEDVRIGDELPLVVKGPLTVMSMCVALSATSAPFNLTDRIMHLFLHRFPAANFPDPQTNVPDVPERAHWDTWMATTLGWPRGYDLWTQLVAAFSYTMTNWMGDDASLQTLNFWRLRPWFLYETMWVHGRVTGKDKSTDKSLVHVDLWADTHHTSERICEGTASVALKTRS